MKVTILFTDESLVTYENIRRICNASRKIPNDMLYLYKMCDIPGQPSIRLPMSNIICVEVLQNGFVQ